MSGTKAGGKKAAETNKKIHGANFYATIGRKGGSKSHPETRHFAMHPELAKIAGTKGGRRSKRSRSSCHTYYCIYDTDNNCVARYKAKQQAISAVIRADKEGKALRYAREVIKDDEV